MPEKPPDHSESDPDSPQGDPGPKGGSDADGSGETDYRDEIRRIWTVTRIGIAGLYRSQLPRMAAALSFRTIFSIIPVMAIGLLIFGAVVSEEQVESGVLRVLEFAGISEISNIEPVEQRRQTPQDADPQDTQTPPESGSQADPDPKPDPQPEPEPELEPGSEPVSDGEDQASRDDAQDAVEGAYISADLDELITGLITRVNRSIREVPTGWIALASGIVLLYAAMSMLIEIEKAFNQLCGAPSGRRLLRRLILYWTILTAGTLLLAATFLAGDAFTEWVLAIAGQDSFVGAAFAGYGVSVLISTVLLLGAYTTIPNTRIHIRTALAGAFFAAVLWELGKFGFTAYLRYSTSYAKFYGSVAILPLFLFWIYVTWLIVLFGMQATYALQNFSSLVETKLKALQGEQRRETALIDPLVMLVIAKLVQRSFENGKPIDAERVSSLTKLRAAQTSDLLEELADAGVLHKADSGEPLDTYLPARPADRIKLRDIMSAAFKLDAFRDSEAHAQLPRSIRDAAYGACDGKTLADLLEENPSPDPKSEA